MNRGSSTRGEASFVHVSSDMFLAGVEGSSQTPKQQQFWECEISSCSQTTTDTNHTAFFSAPAQALPFNHLDHYFPTPPLLPSNPYFAAPTTLTDYHDMGLLKSESGVDLSGGGATALNLGRRTYFSSSSTSSDQGFLPDRLFAVSSSSSSIRGLPFGHPMFEGGQPPTRCQAEGCKSDLFRAKHYHRRHKVCEFHSKASLVVVAGLHQRFCQQCSRFHVVAEFDETKRSCRKRLAEHNRRRRKLPPTTTTTTALCSSKPKPPPNSTRQCTKDRTSMDGPAAAAVCVGGAEVDKGRARGSAAAAMYVEQGRGGMTINHNTPLGEIKVAQQQKKNPRSVVDKGTSCHFHRHNFFSHETGAGGEAGQSGAAWADFL